MTDQDLTRDQLLEEVTRLRAQLKRRNDASPPNGKAATGNVTQCLGALVRNAPLGMHLYALDDDDRLVLVESNAAAAIALNVDCTGAIGETITKAAPALAYTEIPDRLREVALNGTPWSAEQVEYKNGSTGQTLEVHGFTIAPRQIVAVFVDVSLRVHTQDALRQSQEMLRTVLDAIPVRVFWKDVNQVYLGCNRLLAKDSGLDSPHDIVGRTDFEMGWRNEAEMYRADDREVIDTLVPRINYEEPQTTPDGETMWLRTSKIPLRNIRGDVIGVLGTYEDITERKKVEEEKRLLEAQLRQAQKMEAIGRLAGGVAHDFNNILTAVLGYIELAKMFAEAIPDKPAKLCDALRQAENNVGRAAKLTKELLTLSRQQVFKVESVNLNNVIDGMKEMLRRVVTEDIDLTFRQTEALPCTRADTSQIEQVVLNLVLNASDAMPTGGKLSVETSATCLDEQYAAAHAEAQPGEHVVLTVSDTGVGMKTAVLERIFEPFFTTKDVGAGTGLGLATVYGLVNQAGGHIGVESEPGKGSIFRVYWPADAARESVAANAATTAVGNLDGTESVMVCEDDETVRDLTATVLRGMGYEVCETENGRTALEDLERMDYRIDLLITDVIMPDMNGRELVDVLRRKIPDLPVLYISGYTADVIAHHGILDADVQLLQKPFNRHALLTKVREVISQRGE